MFQFNTLNASKKPGLIPCNESRRGSFGKENMNKEFRRGSAALIDVKPGVHDFCYIFTFVFSKPSEWIMRFSDIRYRLEICRDRHDGRSYKNIYSCVDFSRKQRVYLKVCVEVWNLLIYLVSLQTHFLRNYWKFTFSFQLQQKKDQNKWFILKHTLFYLLQKLSQFLRFKCIKIVCRKSLVVWNFWQISSLIRYEMLPVMMWICLAVLLLNAS